MQRSSSVSTHAALTYSPLNGLRLWINGTQFGSGTGNYSYAAATTPVAVTLLVLLSMEQGSVRQVSSIWDNITDISMNFNCIRLNSPLQIS